MRSYHGKSRQPLRIVDQVVLAHHDEGGDPRRITVRRVGVPVVDRLDVGDGAVDGRAEALISHRLNDVVSPIVQPLTVRAGPSIDAYREPILAPIGILEDRKST